MQEQPQMLYIPLVFIKTGVIGGSKSSKNTIQNQYDYNYHDLLKPHLIQNHNSVFYILFHSPSIYNWLRTIPSKESQLLNKYIMNDRVEKSFNTGNNIIQIVNNLQDYVNRWEVVKIAFASTVYVSRVRQAGTQACPHLAKTQQTTIQLSYEPKSKSMICNKLRCKQCQRIIEIEGELRIISDSFISRQISYNLTVKQHRYESFILFSKQSLYIKAANLIWHQINMQTGQTRVIGQNINLKQIQLAVYHLPKQIMGALIQAKPIELYGNSNLKMDKKGKECRLMNSQNNPQMIQQQEYKDIKGQVKQSRLNNGVIKIQSEDNEKISQLKFTPNKVVLNQDEYNHEYIKQVQQHYIQPKTKDEYELDYDKGKLKKIKQKKHYIRPDYNQIYKQVKKEQSRPRYQPSKKIRKGRFDRNDRLDRDDRTNQRKGSHDEP